MKNIGTNLRPRISVYRSNRFISAQAIDDETGKTIAAVSTSSDKSKKTPVEKAKAAGLELAQKMNAKKIAAAIYDRNGHRYHGQIKSLAEGVREGGISM
jgi:large subunit ribosomal protein L18